MFHSVPDYDGWALIRAGHTRPSPLRDRRCRVCPKPLQAFGFFAPDPRIFRAWPEAHSPSRKPQTRQLLEVARSAIRVSSGIITTTYGYHPSGALKSITYTGEPAGQKTPDVTITYDRFGRKTSISSLLSSVLQSSVSYSYDPATLAPDKETVTYPGGLTRVLDRAQDTLGRDTGYTLGAPASAGAETTATYGYSATTGRLETVSGNASGAFSYGYEPNSGLIRTLTRPGLLETQPALRVTNTWDPTRDVLLTKANEMV